MVRREWIQKAQAYFERALIVARQQQAKFWDSAPQRAWRGSGAIRASGMKPAICLLQSTDGSLKASTLAI
jgi:hypothetical protein